MIKKMNHEGKNDHLICLVINHLKKKKTKKLKYD
jgi:hypothetical protein